MKEQRTHTQNSAKCLEVLEFSARNVGPNVYTWSKLFIISVHCQMDIKNKNKHERKRFTSERAVA